MPGVQQAFSYCEGADMDYRDTRPLLDETGDVMFFCAHCRAPMTVLDIAEFGLRLDVWRARHAIETLVYGLDIVASAFLLTWGAEAAERDIPRTLALAGLALIAVLPEYAVDVTFAWKAGKDPSYAAFATANMTGSNRLLIGFGWAVVVGIYWFRTRITVLTLAAVHRS